MRICLATTVLLLIMMIGTTVAFTPPACADSAGPCEGGHSVGSIRDDGRLITLEDGSIWLVADAGVADSLQWVATERVTVCPGRLTNTDNHSTIEAEKLE